MKVWVRASLCAAAHFLLGCSTTGVSIRSTEYPACSITADGSARMEIATQSEDDREVRWVVFYPEKPGKYPLIAFSSGAFSDPDRYSAILRPFAAYGAVVIAPIPIDAEVLRSEKSFAAGEVFATRIADLNAALDPPLIIMTALSANGIAIGKERVAAGHSYGALIAQMAGGAKVLGPDGVIGPQPRSAIDAIIAWSPPGELPGQSARESFASMTAPSLTITGTKDILPGFIDDWQTHGFAYRSVQAGQHELWVGKNIDHYFGGIFGRVKTAEPEDRRLFEAALSHSLGFMGQHLASVPECTPNTTSGGVEIAVRNLGAE